VARVVEKERAAQIYQYITSRMRDPALIEMIGPNTFRARIFPVEARTDLKIEVRFAQTLQATRGGWRWSYALRDETEGGPLDLFTMRLRTSGEARSNLGDFENRRLNIERRSFEAREDARVEVEGGESSLIAAREGGPDGFFALALRDGAGSKSSKRNPRRPSLSGARAYQVVAPAPAGRGARFLFGRYRRSGVAVASYRGRRVSVRFGREVQKKTWRRCCGPRTASRS
jgi:hypothetical protein